MKKIEKFILKTEKLVKEINSLSDNL